MINDIEKGSSSREAVPGGRSRLLKEMRLGSKNAHETYVDEYTKAAMFSNHTFLFYEKIS
jgi:hypothetical protein